MVRLASQGGGGGAGWCAVLVVLAGVVMPALAQVDQQETPPWQPLVEGRQVFEAKGCGRCHAVRAAGSAEEVGPDLARSGSWGDVMQFAGSLWNHTPAMAAKMHEQGMEHPTVSPDEMKKLTGYLFGVRFFGEPGNVARGHELFEQRSCAHCHQLGGRGGTVGPRLDELKDSASAAFMAQALWNHGPEMAVKMSEQKVERPHLQGSEVADIVAYIRGDASDGSRALLYAQAGSPQEGKAIFEAKRCSQCHTIAGTGGSGGPDLGVQRPGSNVAEMAAALWNHGPPMWAKMKERGLLVPKLSDAEMADLLAYLYFVQYMGQTGDATRGSELFRQKACTECHGAGNRGPTGAGDLAASDALRSSTQWAAAMWNHTADLEQKDAAKPPARAHFDDDEMRDLVAFLRAAGARK